MARNQQTKLLCQYGHKDTLTAAARLLQLTGAAMSQGQTESRCELASNCCNPVAYKTHRRIKNCHYTSFH